MDSFQKNIEGVRQLIESGINKGRKNDFTEEGVTGDYEDIFTLKMSDEELLDLKRQWENKSAPYIDKIKTRQEINKVYYLGKQKQNETQQALTVSSNIIFEAEETFIPQALSKNPEPVVWSDNTDEGKEASNQIKTMLQFHADIMCLRKKLGVMLRHWSIYYLGVVKHGWDKKGNDISTEIRKPKNFILDPDGYIDEFGNYCGAYLGEKIECSAERMIELFPSKKDYILIKVDGRLGTMVTRTEWWTDDYCFTTFGDEVLDKHKNEFFNYDRKEQTLDEYGNPMENVIQGNNHFATPRMPYTFLSVFSLQEKPHDETNLIEQNIANQNRINDRDEQIDRNLRHGNNSIAVSGKSFTQETARQAAKALEDGSPVLVPDGRVEEAIKRIPANDIPSAVFNAQEVAKQTLRGVFGTLGLTAQQPDENQTARGMILNKNQDSTRIGGGIGDALEQVADNIFNWWLQLYYVFYDEPHYAALVGSGKAVEYVQLLMTNQNRRFVVSVSPNSMQPKDEISELNMAKDLANTGWLDPINLFKKLNYPDPMETAKMVTLYRIDPSQYYMTYFGNQMQQAQGEQNPPNMQPTQGENQLLEGNLASNPAPSSLGQVPLNAGVAQPK